MGIEPPSEHVFMSFLAKNHDKKQQFIEEFKQDVRETNPHVAVFVNHPYSWSITAQDDQSIFQWCYNYFQDNYRVVGLVEIFPSSPSNFDFTGRSEPNSDYYIWIGLRNDLRNEQSQQQLEITPNNKKLKITPN